MDDYFYFARFKTGLFLTIKNQYIFMLATNVCVNAGFACTGNLEIPVRFRTSIGFSCKHADIEDKRE